MADRIRNPAASSGLLPDMAAARRATRAASPVEAPMRQRCCARAHCRRPCAADPTSARIAALGVVRLRRRRCRVHRVHAVQDAQPHGARRRRLCAPNGCWSARRRARKRTRRASHSSDRPDGCWTTCSRRWACDADKYVYIANVLKCRPPGNRTPEPVEIEACRPYLDRQIELIRPKLIIALGKSAATTLLDVDATIASMRGRMHRYRACR